MRATLFDGSTVQPCTLEQAGAAADQPGIAWIDVLIQGGDDAEVAALLQSAGIDAATQQCMRAGNQTDFVATPTTIRGVCWVANDTDDPAQQVAFAWNQLRLVTLRSGGDDAIAQIQQRVSDRIVVIKQDPSTLLGVVLQFMLATLQEGLTRTMIRVGALDMEIIETSNPKPAQSARLQQYRTQFNDVALRFPMYLVNVSTALIDTGTIAGLDQAGMVQLQQFQSAAQSTGTLIDNLIGSIRNTAQDIQAQVGAWQSNRINVLTIVTMIF
ncbi:MAG: CorA family divalent cation transporter, partial [Actinomycetales bacterium]